MVSLGIFYIYCWLAVAFVRFANDLLLKIKQFFKFFARHNAQDQSIPVLTAPTAKIPAPDPGMSPHHPDADR